MKLLILFIPVIVLFSCGSTKNTGEAKDVAAVDIAAEERIVGTVHIEEGCGVLINAKVGKTDVIIYPNNLDEKFHVEGMKIKFFFKNSSIPVPKTCVAHARGNVDEVTPLR